MDKIFRTKTGYCHVTADAILLTRDANAGSVPKERVARSVARPLIAYGVIAAYLFYISYRNIEAGRNAMGAVTGTLALLLAYGIAMSVNNSAASVIQRSTIRSVSYRKGVFGLSRSRLEVMFLDNGKLKTRLIILPGPRSGGDEAMEQALKIMREEKLM